MCSAEGEKEYYTNTATAYYISPPCLLLCLVAGNVEIGRGTMAFDGGYSTSSSVKGRMSKGKRGGSFNPALKRKEDWLVPALLEDLRL